MLVSHNGAQMTQGDKVLVWGASGGLGSFAVQYVLERWRHAHRGGLAPEKVDLLHDLGVEAVIDRRAAGLRVLEGRAHSGRVGVAPLRQRHPRTRR